MSPRPLGRARSGLFAPAVRPDFLAKLPSRGADLVVIDCEDATPPAAKVEARATARAAAADLIAAGCQVVVRVNSPGSEWFAGDLADALIPDLAAIIVPKVEAVAELDDTAERLVAAGCGDVGVIAGIETALGVADSRALLAHPVVVGGYFGAEDFIADMAGVRTPGNSEVAYARAAVALAARLGGGPLLDQVVTDFGDADRFTREAHEARAMGYAGKLCIHPAQVALANEAFTPTPDEVDRAHRLIAAHEAGLAAGVAAVAFEGQMVDGPLVSQAQRVIAQAES